VAFDVNNIPQQINAKVGELLKAYVWKLCLQNLSVHFRGNALNSVWNMFEGVA
jgi:hypothetical protein